MKIFILRPSLLFFSFLFSFFFTILEFSGRQGLLALRMESCFVISLEDGVLGILDSVAARPPSRFEFWNGWIRMFDGQLDSSKRLFRFGHVGDTPHVPQNGYSSNEIETWYEMPKCFIQMVPFLGGSVILYMYSRGFKLRLPSQLYLNKTEGLYNDRLRDSLIHIMHGKCTNVEPVHHLTECVGHCKSSSSHEPSNMYVLLAYLGKISINFCFAQMQSDSIDPTSNCECCQPEDTKELKTWVQVAVFL